MNVEENNYTLEQIPANRSLVEALYAHGEITREAREYALNFLYPRNQCSLLQKSGTLIGSGIVLLAGRFYLKRKAWGQGGAS